jgi:hypothetical protein
MWTTEEVLREIQQRLLRSDPSEPEAPRISSVYTPNKLPDGLAVLNPSVTMYTTVQTMDGKKYLLFLKEELLADRQVLGQLRSHPAVREETAFSA